MRKKWWKIDRILKHNVFILNKHNIKCEINFFETINEYCLICYFEIFYDYVIVDDNNEILKVLQNCENDLINVDWYLMK